MKNIDEKILMAEEEIKQLQNKRKKLISQQKQEERKKRDRRNSPLFTRAHLYTLKGVCVLQRLLQRAYQLTLIQGIYTPLRK